MDQDAHRHINTDSDSELLLNIFADNLQKTGKVRINEEDIFTAIKGIYDVCHGGYACVAMIAGKSVWASVVGVHNKNMDSYLFYRLRSWVCCAGFFFLFFLRGNEVGGEKTKQRMDEDRL